MRLVRFRPVACLVPLALLAACGGSPATQVQGPPVPASGGGAPPAPATTEATAPATPAAAAAGTDSVRDLVSNQEVERRAAALFGQLPTAPADSADAAAALAAGDVRATWDIDVRSYETHQRVEMWVNVFTGRLREYMQRTMSRGTRYEAFLRRRFREGGLPEDMTYLALIESAYNPHAYSRAAAVGMWQFMTPTARGVGMRVDHWVDERRDPVRATEGAIDFLTDLHEAYGSWYLAAAAYNGGPGRVSRGLARFADEIDDAEGDDRFFALAEQKYLPRETKDYVPKLIAAALVAKEPLRYGLTVDTQPAFAYDSVMVAGGVPLASIARAAGVTLDRVTDLNPQFLRGVTPPGEDTEVRIPAGTREAFGPAFLRLAESEKRGWRELRLDAPTSVTAIADDAGIPLRSLRWYNPRLAVDRRGRVRAGTMLRIPTVDALAAARDVPDPSLERYRRVASAPEVALVSQRHRVRRGETLGAIARRYGVSVSQLRAMNAVPGGRVRSGQVLVVRRPSRAAVARARRSLAASNARGGTRCTNQVVRVKGKRRTVRRCAAVRSSVAAREDGGGASGSRCTSRVIRSKGKTRTVRRCVAVREGAASARAGSARTGTASTGRSSTSRDARPSGKAKRKAKSARSAAGSTSARRAPR